MNVAVSLGASAGLRFAEYVDWLASNGHVTVKSKSWVDHIRDKGNEANHEIPLIPKEEAEQVIKFVEMLLRTNFEYPESIPKSTP